MKAGGSGPQRAAASPDGPSGAARRPIGSWGWQAERSPRPQGGRPPWPNTAPRGKCGWWRRCTAATYSRGSLASAGLLGMCCSLGGPLQSRPPPPPSPMLAGRRGCSTCSAHCGGLHRRRLRRLRLRLRRRLRRRRRRRLRRRRRPQLGVPYSTLARTRLPKPRLLLLLGVRLRQSSPRLQRTRTWPPAWGRRCAGRIRRLVPPRRHAPEPVVPPP